MPPPPSTRRRAAIQLIVLLFIIIIFTLPSPLVKHLLVFYSSIMHLGSG